MVGEGVLRTCLEDAEITEVLVITRRPTGYVHDKITEIIHDDFTSFAKVTAQLSNIDAAFLCMGVSSMGLSAAVYRKLTYEMTLALAQELVKLNPAITLTYVSGAGTDSSASRRVMWARIKGETENALLALAKKAYVFRPGYIIPMAGAKNTYRMYKILAPLNSFLKRILPRQVGTLDELSTSMVLIGKQGYKKSILEVTDIRESIKDRKGTS